MSLHFVPSRNLPGDQECPNQLTLAAHSHPRKPPEPSAFRNIGLLIEPLGQKSQMVSGDAPILNAV